jgi:hypothetical protein
VAINRPRLKELLNSGADGLTDLAEASIKAKLAELPMSMRLLAPTMVGLLQIRSTISAAATQLSDELDEDELWSLKLWIGELVNDVLGLPYDLPSPTELESRVRAIAHLRAVLSA